MLGIRPTRAYKEEMRKKAQSAILRDKKSLNSITEFRTIFYDEQAVIRCQEGMGNQLDKIFFFFFSPCPPPPLFADPMEIQPARFPDFSLLNQITVVGSSFVFSRVQKTYILMDYFHCA